MELDLLNAYRVIFGALVFGEFCDTALDFVVSLVYVVSEKSSGLVFFCCDPLDLLDIYDSVKNENVIDVPLEEKGNAIPA